LFTISYYSKKDSGNDAFFKANKILVVFGRFRNDRTALSGVTFISVPGGGAKVNNLNIFSLFLETQ
jgi:hypothetical protein